MPVTTAAIIGGSTLAGGLLGNVLAGQQAQALAGSNRLQQLSSLAQLLNRPPEIGNITYQQYAAPIDYELAGTLNPEQLQETELRNILRNEQARQAQLDVLGEYQDLSQTGLTAVDRAALTDIQNQIATQERGQREAILQNMAQRGLSGSGTELAANLLAGQSASQRASQMGMDQASQAQQARLQALGNVARMGQGLEETDFQRAAREAEASDVINQFNTRNKIVAEAENLANKQDIMNLTNQQRNRLREANTDLINQALTENVINKPLAQYGLQSRYTSGVAGGLQDVAGSRERQAMNQYNTQSQMLGAGLQTGGSLAGSYMNRPTTPQKKIDTSQWQTPDSRWSWNQQKTV
jgi:hypothetical protein